MNCSYRSSPVSSEERIQRTYIHIILSRAPTLLSSCTSWVLSIHICIQDPSSGASQILMCLWTQAEAKAKSRILQIIVHHELCSYRSSLLWLAGKGGFKELSSHYPLMRTNSSYLLIVGLFLQVVERWAHKQSFVQYRTLNTQGGRLVVHISLMILLPKMETIGGWLGIWWYHMSLCQRYCALTTNWWGLQEVASKDLQKLL